LKELPAFVRHKDGPVARDGGDTGGGRGEMVVGEERGGGRGERWWERREVVGEERGGGRGERRKKERREKRKRCQ
jgi:hypothetical protein